MLLLFALFIVLLVLFWPIVAITKTRRCGIKLPGPLPLPVIGNGHNILGNSPKIFENICNLWKQYGTRFRVFIGNRLMIVLSDPKDVEVLLSDNFFIDKAFEYTLLHNWLGTGLLTSKGQKWRAHRKMLTPTFHLKILEHYVQTFESQAEVFCSKLKPRVDKDSFDVFNLVTYYTLDVISEAAMGVTIGAQNNSNSEYVNAVKETSRSVMSRFLNPLKQLDWMFALFPDYWSLKRSLKVLHDYTEKMIKERRAILSQNPKTDLDSYIGDDSNIAFGAKKKLAFLDMLLLSTINGVPLTDLEIRDEVDTFLFEGHDTTASAVSFALYLIAHNGEAQQKIYKEQKTIFGNDMDRMATLTDLQNMKYLELCIKETLRLYPSVPAMGRSSKVDQKINDLEIPAGVTLAVLIYGMNRNPDVFRDPEKFIPERFLPEECLGRNPFANVSFSAGPRNCIGQKFAMLEMKSVLSSVVKRYELLPSNEELILTMDLILRVQNGIHIKITDRKH